MTDEQAAIARHCLNGAYDNTMSFPESIGKLLAAGFEGYLVDYRQNTRSCYLPNGEAVTLANPHAAGTVAAEFSQAAVAAAVKWAQSQSPDYRYAEFNRRVTASGCAGYIVSFIGRRVVYFGRTAETHIEYFPAQPGQDT